MHLQLKISLKQVFTAYIFSTFAFQIFKQT